MKSFPLDTENSPSYILEMLFDLKVRDVMHKELITAERDDPLQKIQAIMRENRISGVPIIDKRRLIGLVSMDDIIQALADGKIEEGAETRMTRNLIVLEDDMPLSFAISYMEKYRFGRFPVINRNRELVGIITSRDIIVHLLINMNREMEQIEERQRILSGNPELRFSLPTTSTGSANADQDELSPVGAGDNEQPGCSDLNPDDGIKTEPSSKAAAIPDLSMQWHTRKFDFEEAGKASTEIKKTLREHRPDLPAKLVRRIAIASYELEMNQVVHSEGGKICFLLEKHQAKIIAEDRGPGIDDIEAALTEGWSTATEWVRSLGFGAGMGLPNTRRVADDFAIESGPDGTTVEVGFSLPVQEEAVR